MDSAEVAFYWLSQKLRIICPPEARTRYHSLAAFTGIISMWSNGFEYTILNLPAHSAVHFIKTAYKDISPFPSIGINLDADNTLFRRYSLVANGFSPMTLKKKPARKVRDILFFWQFSSTGFFSLPPKNRLRKISNSRPLRVPKQCNEKAPYCSLWSFRIISVFKRSTQRVLIFTKTKFLSGMPQPDLKNTLLFWRFFYAIHSSPSFIS